MEALTLGQHTFERLRSDFKGQIILPSDPEYDEARKVWNGIIDKYPALIVRPLDNDDVIAALRVARARNLVISVRGGGHNVAGHATNNDGIVIDLSAMKKIEVDAINQTARAEGGVTWGELDAATQKHGLATPGGVFSKTGIAGLTLGGGYGWLSSKYGLSCDNLIGVEIVTADGQVVRANETENSDLLWALRGGGGNFGIVTSFEYKLHPLGPDAMFVFVMHKGETTEDMLRAAHFYAEFTENAPDEISTIMSLGKVPPDENFPEELHHERFAMFAAMYAGPVEEGVKALQPLIDFGEPLLDFSGVQPYLEVQQMFDEDYPDGLRYYWKSLNLQTLNDDAIACLVDHARQQVSPFSTTDVWRIGGAVSRVSPEESAFFGRHAKFLLNPEANWIDPADDVANIQWVRQFIRDMEPFSDGSRYLNFAGFQEEGNEMMRKAYGPHYELLVALKQKYDPDNLFRLNQNIKP